MIEMKKITIYIKETSEFGKFISDWALEQNIQVESISHRTNHDQEKIKGVVLFHDNHNFTKEDIEWFDHLTHSNIPGHRVDIDGTVPATRSNFLMWLENNHPESLLFLGDQKVMEHQNLRKFIAEL